MKFRAIADKLMAAPSFVMGFAVGALASRIVGEAERQGAAHWFSEAMRLSEAIVEIDCALTAVRAKTPGETIVDRARAIVAELAAHREINAGRISPGGMA